MVRRAGLEIIVILIFAFIISGCDNKGEDNIKRMIVPEEGDKVEDLYMTDNIADLLNCEKETAQSIERVWSRNGINQVLSIEKVPDRGYHILKLLTGDGETYFVFIGRNLMVKRIRRDALDGELIYRAME